MKQFYQKILTLGLTALLFFTASNVMGQGTEDFTNSNATGSYSDNSFTGNDGITWTYVASRDGNNDANSSGINLPALMLRRDTEPSKITSSTISGGIGDFSIKLYKGFTGGGDRQVELFVNGVSKGTSTAFDDFTEHVFTVEDINIDGDVIIEIVNITSKQVIIDDISWTGFVACSAPTTQATFGAFTGTGDNATTINFTRGDGDGVIILAKEGSAVDATPSSGTAYSANAAFGSGDEIGTGNFVVYNETGTTEDLTALALGTTYHFAAFEYNTTGTCYLTPGATTDVTTTGDALPEIISAVTPATETSNDIIITFSEDVSFTTEGGFAIEIGTPLATIQSQTQTASNEITLTIAEDISKNSEEIILSYNAFVSGASIVDGGSQALQNTNETIVNNTTLNLVANVTEARALSSGEDVRITGGVIVTYLTGNTRNQFFIQDADAGLLVDDNSGTVTTSYNAGDEIINFQGTLSSFSGVTQFVPAADPGAANSTGNTITPVVVTIADHNANPDIYESRVLRFNEVTFNEADGTATFDAQASATSTLNDGANTLDFDADISNAFSDFVNIDYATNVIPQGRLDVIAIGRDSKVSSRSAADIQDNYEPIFTQAPAASTPTVSAFDVTFRMDEPGRVYYTLEPAPNTGIPAEVVLTSLDFVDYTDVTADGTISLTGLEDGTEYFVHIIAVDDEGTPNEQTSTTVVSATTEAVVFDATSDIVAASSPIGAATLSSVANADTDAVNVFNFTVTDDNATDTEPTTINTITIENNNSATWSSIIEGASITDGVTAMTATSITDSEITFDASATPYIVTGGGELTFTLSVWLQTAQTDGTELSFTIPTAHGFESDAAGSVIKATLDAAVTSTTHTIDVVATTFATTSPARVKPSTDFAVSAVAQDANGNTDVAARSIDVSVAAGTLGTLTSVTGLTGQAMTAGEFTFADLQYDAEEDIVLDIADGSILASTDLIIVSDASVEDFANSNATSSYAASSFIGNNGIEWSYVESRDANNDTNGSGIDLPALMLRRISDNSKITSSTISGGIGDFSVKLYKGFTGAGERQVSLYINGDSITSSTPFDNFDEQIFEVTDVNIDGDFVLEIRNKATGQIIIDDITWTSYVDLCTEPTTQATALGATVVDNNTIDLAWTVGNGDATLVLAKQGTAVDADPEILNAYTADAAFGAGTELGSGNFVVYNGADAAVQVTGLTQGTSYHFAAYAFNTANNCYYLVDPALANVTTTSNNDSDSDISAADAPIAAATIPATTTTAGSAVDVFSFKISDLGTADAEPTIVNSVTIVPGASNTAAWSTVLAGATLSTNTFSAENATITDAGITFDLSTNAFTVNDGADSTLTLSVYLNAAQVDGDVVSFAIPAAHEFVADGVGSLFAETVTGATSNDHIINVEATTLVLTANTTSNTDTPFTIGVSAEDANGNLDTGARTVVVSGGGSGTLTGTTDLTLTDGVGTFTGLSYDTEETVTFTVTDGTLSATTDITFSTPSANNNLFFSEYGEGSSNNKYIEIYNATSADFDLSTVEVKQSNNGSGFDGHPDFPAAYSITLQGTLAAGDVYVIVNSSTNIEEIAQEGDLFLSYGDNPGDRVASFNGDDAMGLFVNGELVDLIGDPAVDPGSAWDVAGVTGGTQDHTLVRKSTVTSGNTTALGSFGTDASDSEWIVNPQNDFSNLGFHQVAGDDIPELTVVESITDFGSVENGQVSSSQSFTVAGSTLLSDIVLTVTSNYELSIDDTNFSSELTLSATNNTVAETTVFVRFAPNSGVDGVIDGLVSINTTGAVTEEITLTGSETGNPEVLFAENFENCDVTNYNTFSVTGDQEWSCTNFGQTGSAVRMNGFSSGAQENEDWLITNAVALSSAFSANFSFFSDVSFPVESVGLEVLISEDYAGSGDPTTANWTALSVTLDENGDSDSWTSSGLVDLTAYAGKSVYFAFKYNSTTDGAAQWTIDNLLVQLTNTAISSSLVVDVEGDSFDFGSVETGSVSAAQSFTVSGLYLTEDISITASSNYQVSLIENDAFDTSTTLPINPDGSLEEITVYVRFAPTAEVGGTINGTVTVNSGDIEEVVINLTASEQLVVTANTKNQLTGVMVFPNPVQNQLNVNIEQGGQFTYQVIGLQGATLIKGAGNTQQTINVSALKAGVYILEVIQEGKSFRSRVIKR
ncbi:hypothetical protein GCM10027429_27160 [Marivirga atlantica]|jgi:hypothetical protein|uniref:Choice-of-anchor J domain-containing protein n=1 Tax=Marivirga atlantica TaxID=1548457 RepID=A0A937AML8_9BACT|nr:choice-of-anchor J domain-containing protein [Marivirga atlantica]MBL0766318.1 choice-of-anchor J domain-containing protein [Marivirga atlantica]